MRLIHSRIDLQRSCQMCRAHTDQTVCGLVVIPSPPYAEGGDSFYLLSPLLVSLLL